MGVSDTGGEFGSEPAAIRKVFTESLQFDEEWGGVFRQVCGEWRDNVWLAVDDIAMAVGEGVQIAKIEIMGSRIEPQTHILIGAGEVDNDLYTISVAESVFELPCIPPRHSTFNYREIGMFASVLNAWGSKWPLESFAWDQLQEVFYEIERVTRTGGDWDDLPHRQFRRCLVRCVRQVQALTLFAGITQPNGHGDPAKIIHQDFRPGREKGPPEELVQKCVQAIKMYAEQRGGEIPNQSGIYRLVGGKRQTTLAAAKIAIERFRERK